MNHVVTLETARALKEAGFAGEFVLVYMGASSDGGDLPAPDFLTANIVAVEKWDTCEC